MPGMNDPNFAQVILQMQEAQREDRENLRRHIDDCIAERRDAKRDRHEMANRVTALGAELHTRITHLERRGMRFIIGLGGSVIALLLGIIGWLGVISFKGFFLSGVGG